MRRCIVVLPPLVALAILAGSCSSGDDSGSSGATSIKPAAGPDLSDVEFQDSTGATAVTIQVRDNTFATPYLEVTAGTTITFENKGRNEHNVYPAEDGAFTPIDAATLAPGSSATLTLDDPGDVPYYCTLHGTTTKGMVGAIRVVG